MEVMTAARPGEEGALRLFLSNFVVLPITNEVAERAVVLRREQKLNLPDAIILATAETTGRRLVTRNTRDFPAAARRIRVPRGSERRGYG
jgi:predicted nucleic acid-binding protein